jgi:hypothetical protein
MNIEDAKSFLNSVLDLSFSNFITTKLIRIIYLIFVILSCISGMAIIVAGMFNGIGAGILSLIVAPLVVALEIMVCRVFLEIVMVIFKIAKDVDKIANDR